MKVWKRVIYLLLTMCMLLEFIPQLAYASWGEETTLDGILHYVINNNQVEIVGCNKAVSGKLSIPEEIDGYPVTSVNGLDNCAELTQVTIPDTVTKIGNGCFKECSKLKSIRLSGNITRLEDNTFYKCIALEYIVIPDGVTSIGWNVFWDCSNLRYIEIPVSVKRIGSCTLWNCRSLEDLYYTGSQEEWNAFDHGMLNDGFAYAEYHFNSSAPRLLLNSANSSIPADQYGIIVVGSDGKPISGASVTWSYGKVIGNDFSETKQTDQTGAVLFPRKTEGEPLIEVSCDGYKSYTNKGTNYAKSDKGYDVIRLYKESESDLLLRYAKYKNSTNLLTGVKTLNLKNTGNLIGDLTSGDFTISCQAIIRTRCSRISSGRMKIRSPTVQTEASR